MRLILILLGFVVLPPLAMAQNDPSVEINMTILDEFEEEEFGLDWLDDRAIPNARVGEPEVTFSQDQERSTQINVIPVPERKPGFVSTITTGQLQAIQMEDRLVKRDGVAEPEREPKPTNVSEDFEAQVATHSVPIPKKRPSVMNAPQSFIDEARKAASAPQEPKTTTAPPPVQKNAGLDGELMQPSVEDILASIDPSQPQKRPEPKVEPPAPIKTRVEADPALEMPAYDLIEVDEKDIISLGYKPEITDLPEQIKTALEQKTIFKIKELGDPRIEVLAYASAADDNPISARRTSLARALAIRDFLVASGIDTKKINLRPLGDTAKSEPMDRADLRFIR